MATKIEEYTQNGKKLFRFQKNLGKNYKTGEYVRVRKSGFTSKAEARQALTAIQKEFDEGRYTKRTDDTFEDIAKLWFENRYVHDVKESTANKTKQLFDNHVLPEFKGKRIQTISTIDCTNAVNKWTNKIKNSRALKNYASKVFDFAINLEIINNNPMSRVLMPKQKQHKKDINFYTKDELQVFLECAAQKENKMWFPYFRLIAFSGMRKGEASGLQWKHINFRDNTITIEQTLSRGFDNKLIIQDTKTTAGNRVISMDKKTMEILAKWRKQQLEFYFYLGINTNNIDQFIFTNSKNEYLNPSTVTRRLNDIIRQNDLEKITTHQLRHTHASLLFDAGVPIKEVQERLGHSSYDITMDLYTHIYDERKDETAQKFAEFVGF